MNFLMIHKSDGHSIFINKNEVVSIEEIMTFGGKRAYITMTTGKEIETNDEFETLISKLKTEQNTDLSRDDSDAI